MLNRLIQNCMCVEHYKLKLKKEKRQGSLSGCL